MAAIVMKMVSILRMFVLCMLTASSQGQVIIGACDREELRRAAVNKALASIGCDSYACGKFTS